MVENIPGQIHCSRVRVVKGAPASRGIANGIHSFLVSADVSEQRHLARGPNALSPSHGKVEAIGKKKAAFLGPGMFRGRERL